MPVDAHYAFAADWSGWRAGRENDHAGALIGMPGGSPNASLEAKIDAVEACLPSGPTEAVAILRKAICATWTWVLQFFA